MSDAAGNDAADDPVASPDLDAVIAANAAFYDAFERRDFDAMSDLWEHSDRVVCTHPGWSTLHGWARIAGSWVALFRNAQRLQFILTEVHAVVEGDTAWVNVDENILDGPANSTVAALNVFVRDASRTHGWRLLVHHGSVVHSRATP
jgi:ketosteroid isomerase-like protein